MCVRSASIRILYLCVNFTHVGVPLVEEQEEELATLINAIDQHKIGESSLNEILSEAEKSGEGRGQVLKSVWNTETEKASFFKDQMRNSMFLCVHINCV